MKSIVLIVFFLLATLSAQDLEPIRVAAKSLPIYQRQFLLEAGIAENLFKPGESLQAAIPEVVKAIGVDAVKAAAKAAKDMQTGGPYFHIYIFKNALVIEKSYPLVNDIRDLELIFLMDESGEYTKASFCESIVVP
jgi:hypothetical protein